MSDALTLEGYASVTGVWYEVGWYEERLARGAFKRTLKNENLDTQLLINHAGLPLARTTSGTLTLREDDKGLLVRAELDPEDPDVRALAPKMRRGDVTEMSFAFRVLDQDWSEDYSRRDISSVDIHRGDVSVVSYGASPTTSTQLRAQELLGAGKAQQRNLSVDERERRANEIGRKGVGVGSITAVDGAAVQRPPQRTRDGRSQVVIPDHTISVRLLLAALNKP